MTKEVAKFTKTEKAILSLVARHQHTPDELDHLLTLVEGAVVVKEAKKEFTTHRTTLAAFHKEVKAPILAAGKAVDAEHKRLLAMLKVGEDVIDAALLRHKNKEADAAASTMAARIAELEAQVAQQGAALVELGAEDDDMVPKSTVLTITTKAQLDAVAKLLGKDATNDLKFEDGTPYVLEVEVRRKELQL